MDSEIAIKNKVIADYKAICSQLSEKLEKAQQQKPSKEKPNEASSDETKTETPVSENQEIGKLNNTFLHFLPKESGRWWLVLNTLEYFFPIRSLVKYLNYVFFYRKVDGSC